MSGNALRRSGIVLGVLALLVALYAASGFLLAPWLVQRHGLQLLQDRLDRTVAFGAIEVNPFLLTFELRDFSVEGRHGTPVVAADRVFADLALIGLLRRTWTLQEVAVEGLRAHLVREPDGTLNLVELASRLMAAEEPEPRGAPWVVLEQLTVPAADLVFSDLSGSEPASARLGPIALQASGLSNIAQRRGSFALRAALPEGGSLALDGELRLSPALDASGQVKLQGLQAASLRPFLRDELRLSAFEASAGLSGRFAYDGANSLRLDGATIELSDLLLAGPGEQNRLLDLKRITVTGASLDLARREVTLEKLVLAQGAVNITLAADASLNWAQLVASTAAAPQGTVPGESIGGSRPAAPSGAARAQAGAVAPWRLEAAALHVEQVALHYVDRSRPEPLAVDIGEIGGQLRLSLGTGAPTQLVVDALQARLQNLRLGAPGLEAQLSVAAAQVAQGHLDLRGRRLGAGQLTIDGGQAAFVRQPDGRSALLDLFAGADAAQPGPGNAGASWEYAVDAVRIGGLALRYVDHGFEPPLAFDGTLQARASGIATDQGGSFDATLSLAEGGALKASGSAAPGLASVQARVEAEQLPVALMQPLLQQVADLRLRSGAASASAMLRYGYGGLDRMQASGNFRIVDFLATQPGSDEPFLAWRQLDAQGVELAPGERRLSVREVNVSAPQGRIAISREGNLNLAQVIRRPEGAQAPQVEQPARARQPDAGSGLEVERMNFSGGTVQYEDLSLVLPFSAVISEFEGAIAGISNDPARRADLKASGVIAPYGSARLAGSIVPAAPTRFTDLQLDFNNVPVPPLSAYTATFAGRKVESGRLWLDLDYLIVEGELKATNDIRLANFSLGEQVDSPDAMNLPLNLAVALLTDANGEINLTVPLTGDLQNPSFSVASAVFQAVGNALQRIVTAPFRALGNLLGGGDESLAAIEFLPGSAQLRPEQVEKLDALTRALRERPRLQLVVSAPYDTQADAGVLQRAQARELLAQRLGRQSQGKEPGPIAFDDADTRREIQRLLRELGGAQAVRETYETFARKPGADPRLIYEAMFQRIAALQPVPGSAVQVLAATRARTIGEHLVQRGVAPGRVQTGAIVEVRAGGDSSSGITATLEVAAAGAPG